MKKNIMKTIAISLVFTLITQSAYPFSADKANLTPKNTLSPKHQGVSLKVLPSLIRLWYSLKDISLSRPCTVAELGENLPYISSSLPGNTEIYSRGGILLLRIYTGGKDISYLAISPSKVTEREIRDFSGDTGVQINSIEKVFSTDEFSIYAWGIPCLSRDKLDYVSIFRVFLEALSRSSPDDKRIICDIAIRIFRQFLGRNASRLNSVFACFSDGIVFSDKKGRPLQLVYRRDNELKGIDISWIPDISDIADEDSKYKIVTRCGNKYYVEKTTGVQYRDKGNKDTKLREENTLRLIIIGSYIISFWIFAQNILIAILEDYFTFGVLLENIIYVIPTIFIVNFLLITIIILFINKDKLPIHTKSITNIPILPIHSEDMPTVTVMIPVYKEPFYVIHNALSTGLEAIRYYNERAGGKANIVVSDDGLMVFSDNNLIEFEKNARQKQPHQRTEEEQEVIERLDFYRGNNIPFVARPKPVQGDVDTVREGSFKKPGNLNFTLELDMLLRDSLRNGFSYQEAVDNIRKTHRRYRLAHVEGQISIGDFIASLDKDSRIPKEFIWLDIPEFLNDPNLAFTMHETRGYEIGEQTYFGKVMTYFLHVLYDVMIHYKTRAGAYTPYMGHNGIVRRAALGEKGLWDPFMVADDLAFAMDAWKEGLYGKYITFPGLECEEAISDNFSDESSKHRRYLFSILQIYLNPIKKWLKEGFWGLKGREFLGSKKVSIWIKLDLLMYAFSFMSILLIIPISILSVFGVTLSISPYILLGFIVWLAFVMIIFHIQSGYYKDGNVPKGIINDILSNTGIGIFFVAIGPRLIRSFIEFFKNKQPDFGSTNVDTKRHTTFRKLISLMKPEIINSTILSIITVFLGVFLFIQNKPLFELCLLLLIVCIPLLFNPAFMSKLKEEVRARYRYGKVIFAIGIIGLIIYAFIAGFGWLNWKTDEFIHYNYDRPVQEFAYKHYQEHSPPHLYPTPLIDSGSDKTGPSPEGGGYKKTSSPRGKENKKSRHGGFEIERYWSLETLWSPIDGNGDYKSLDTRVQEMWELYNKEDCGDAMIVANNITREFGGIAEEQNEKKGVYFAYDPGDISTKDIINSYWALNSVASAHYIAAHCAQKLNLPGTALWHINKLYEVYYNAQIYDPVNDWFWSPVGDELWELEESGTASLDSSGKESPPSLLDSQLSDDELIEKYWEKIVEAFNGDTEKAKEYVKKYKELPPGEKKKVKDYIIGLGLFEKSLYWVVAVEAVLFAVTYLVGILFPIMLPIPFAFFIINSLQLFYLYTAKYREHIYPIITDFLKFGVPVKEGISSTDRLRIYFNPAYMSRLPVGIQKTIFFHERLHKGMAILKTPYLNIVRNAIEEFILHLLDNIYLAYYFFSRSASVRDKIDSSILDDLSEELGLSDPERDLLKRLMLDKRIKYDAIVNRLLKKDDLEDVIERLRRALRLVELRIPDLGIEDKLKLVYSIVYIDYKGAEALPLELEYSESYAPETLDEFICWLRNILESKKLPDYIADGILDVFLRKHIYKCTNETFNGFIDKLGCLLNRDIKRFKPIKEIRRNLKPQDEERRDVYRITKKVELFLDGLKTVSELSFEGSVNIVQSPETGKLGLILRRKDGEVKAIELNAEPLDSKVIDALWGRTLQKIKDIEDLVLRRIVIETLGYLKGKTFYAIQDNPYIVGVANNRIICINKVFGEGSHSPWDVALFRISMRVYLNNNPDMLPIGTGVDEIVDRLQSLLWEDYENKSYKGSTDPIRMRLKPEGYDTYDSGVWVFSKIPCRLEQGWKIHIATRKEDALEILELVLPIIKKYKLPHKVCRLNAIDELEGTQVGKFICVYIDRLPGESSTPEDIAREMGLEIDRVLQGRGVKPPDGILWNGTGDQGDKLIKGGKSGLVGYRYGAFRGDYVEVNGRITMDKRDRYKPEGQGETLTGTEENAFLVGKGNEEFLTEVKGAIRDAYRKPGAIRQYRWDNGRVIVETNRGGDGEAEFSPVILSDYEKELFEYMFNNVIDKGIKLVFVEGLNLINYRSLSMHQIARASSTREQLYFPMNILYLIHLSTDAEGALRHIIKHEEYHKREPLASEEDARRDVEKDGNKEAFLELLQLAGAVEEIAQRIVKHAGRDLMLYLDMEGKLRIKGTDRDVEIFDIDSESIVVEDKELRLTYWDVLRSRLKGRKDTILEIIPKGLELTDIRKLLIQGLLRRQLISQDEALTKRNLRNLGGIASRIQNRMKICISSKHLVDNVVKTGENRFGYNQNSSGIKYLLDRIGSGFRVEIINESGVSDGELQTLISSIFGLGQNFSTKNIAVINQQDAIVLDCRDSILLLHEDSAGALKSLKDRGVKVLIGEKGVSINVLVTVGIYKLLGKTEDEMEKLLLGLGYTKRQISEMVSEGLINLPPIPSLLPLINDMASIRRMIDISA